MVSPTAGATIDLRGLTKRFGEKTAVADLDLQVAPAQVFGFLGPNGAGKSTTIRMLMGLSPATAGSATVLGRDAWAEGPRIRDRVGYLAGELALPPRMNGGAVLDWTARARGGGNPQRRAELVRRFDADLERPVHALSKGNRQKIGLIRAFEHDPELLVLDEPTSGLDPLLQKEFADLLAESVDRGRTVFLSSHDLDEVQQVADHIAIIRDGELVLSDTVAGLRARAPRSVELTFAGPVDATAFEQLADVTVVSSAQDHLVLSVGGSVEALLATAAAQHAVDIVARPADLDELFRSYYREQEARDAR